MLGTGAGWRPWLPHSGLTARRRPGAPREEVRARSAESPTLLALLRQSVPLPAVGRPSRTPMADVPGLQPPRTSVAARRTRLGAEGAVPAAEVTGPTCLCLSLITSAETPSPNRVLLTGSGSWAMDMSSWGDNWPMAMTNAAVSSEAAGETTRETKSSLSAWMTCLSAKPKRAQRGSSSLSGKQAVTSRAHPAAPSPDTRSVLSGAPALMRGQGLLSLSLSPGPRVLLWPRPARAPAGVIPEEEEQPGSLPP